MSLTALVVKRPSLVLVLIALTMLAGLLAAPKLPRQQYPNVDLPTIQVSVSDPGASTGQMRDAIVRPLEDQIAGAPSLDHMTTTIEQGQATIAVAFSLGSDKNADLSQVQNRVQIAQPNLPSDVSPPVVAAFDPTQGAVISLVAVAPTLSLRDLSARLTASIIPALTQLPGVGGVSLSGNVVPSYQVEVDPRTLVASGYTLGDVINTISDNNVRAPGGIVYGRDRETGLTVRGDVRSPQSISELALPPLPGTSHSAAWQSSSVVSIGAVADVRDTYEPRRIYAFSRGTSTIALDVTKATGASDIETSNAVLAALPRLASAFPDIQLRVVAIESRYTREQVTSALRSLIEAIILASLAMLVFLRSWRHAIVVLIAIPTSLCVTLAFMAMTGMTLDTVSLGAMTLAIGILVDDSTVVLENITRRFAQGEDAQTAAVRGRMEIGLAAVALTFVDVVVFVPIAFLPGMIGRFLQEFGAVVVVATLTSLAVGFIVTPSLAARWSLLSRWRPPRVIDAFDAGFERVRALYAERVLPAALRHPPLVIATAVLSLVFAIALVPTGIVGFTFLPPDDRGAFFVQVKYPAGTPLERTAAGMLRLEHAVDGIADLDAETTIAGGYQASFGGIVNEGSVGQIHVFLRDRHRTPTLEWRRFIEREAARLLPDAQTIVIPAGGLGGGPSQDVDVVVRASHSDAEAAAARVARALADTPGTYAVTTLAQRRAPQLDVGFNRRRASVLGVSIGSTSQAVHAAFGGARATQFSDELGTHDVNVIYPLADQHDLATVDAIAVRANAGAIVHVGDVAALENVPQAPVLTRQDRASVVHVSANVLPGVALSNVERAFAARRAALQLPSDVVVGPSANGSEQNLHDLRTGVSAALVVSLVLIYLLLAALYDGFATPFVVMLAVPVAAVGALGALALTGETLNLFSLIGTILLLGLVIKNGVLLVDFANTRVRSGESASVAVVESATLRFRPIVMTTAVMVVSMLPVALALEPGSAVRRSLGIVVIGGLSSSLLLTLVLVPVIFVALAPRPRRSIVSAGTVGPDEAETPGVTAPLSAGPSR